MDTETPNAVPLQTFAGVPQYPPMMPHFYPAQPPPYGIIQTAQGAQFFPYYYPYPQPYYAMGPPAATPPPYPQTPQAAPTSPPSESLYPTLDNGGQRSPIVDRDAQQQCKRCGFFYKEKDNNEKACTYHNGRYKTPDSIGPVMMQSTMSMRWSCCRNPEQDSPGCKVGRHVPDANAAKALQRFDVVMPSAPTRAESILAVQSPPSSSIRGPLVNFDDDEDGENVNKESKATAILDGDTLRAARKLDRLNIRPKEEDEEQTQDDRSATQRQSPNLVGRTEDGTFAVRHEVRSTDTLPGLALKYGVKKDVIKQANNLIGESVFERKHLLIPNPTRLPSQEELAEAPLPKAGAEQIATARFVKETGCDRYEAKYYLTEAGHDLKKALAMYREDLQWEAKNVQRK